MIRVHKDLLNIPHSLSDSSTNSKRNDCIRNMRYKQDRNFHKRFKQPDIKTLLKSIYNQKCAYCEQKVIDSTGNDLYDNTSTIDHYRPKSVYYWLAYSWDNLLWCCHGCNKNKDNKFDFLGTKVSYATTFLSYIHNSANNYNATEQPKFIHPEFENVTSQCRFDTNGMIDSDDARVKYTITECGIDRDDLNEKRKKILDILKEKVNDRRLQDRSHKDIMENFINNMKNKDSEFIAFRYWVLNNIKSLV